MPPRFGTTIPKKVGNPPNSSHYLISDLLESIPEPHLDLYKDQLEYSFFKQWAENLQYGSKWDLKVYPENNAIAHCVEKSDQHCQRARLLFDAAG